MRGLLRTLVAAGIALLAGAVAFAAHGGSARSVEGGVFRMNVSGTDVRTVDPALASDAVSGQVILATCAHLLYYPDRNGTAGTRVTPEVAAAMPRVSDGGRTYTFRVREGFRFNTGEAVTA